jgi:hypothetical protein
MCVLVRVVCVCVCGCVAAPVTLLSMACSTHPITPVHAHPTVPPPKQGFNIDTWALGLCFFHLLTGRAHYHALTELKCPPALAAALKAVWNIAGKGAATRKPRWALHSTPPCQLP